MDVILDNIGKKYEGREDFTIRHIDLTIKSRQFCVILGPSGCGKSTLLRMIAGLNSITEGQLIFGDKIMNSVPPRDRDIAMVFQSYALYPHMTIFDNMAFSLKMRKESANVIHDRVMKAAEVLQIQDYLYSRPSDISGGQRQRVALGRAMVRKPSVFLMDEPLSNLDAKLREQMRVELVRLHQHLGTTTIYVTHDQTEAMTMADKIILLNEGRIQQAGSPAQLYQKPANIFVARFIGSPSMNLFTGSLQGGLFVDDHEVIHIRPSRADLEQLCPYEGKPIILGIRGERLTPVGGKLSVGSNLPASNGAEGGTGTGVETEAEFGAGSKVDANSDMDSDIDVDVNVDVNADGHVNINIIADGPADGPTHVGDLSQGSKTPLSPSAYQHAYKGIAHAQNIIQARVEVVEMLGKEQLLNCRLSSGQECVVSAPGHLPFESGESCHFFVDTEALHFFDAETGERINN